MKKLLLILAILTPLILTSPTNHITIAQLIPVPAEEYEKLICEAILKLKPSDLKKITDIEEENFKKAGQELLKGMENKLYNLEKDLFDYRDKTLKDDYVSLPELELLSNKVSAIKKKEIELNETLSFFNLSINISDECQYLSNLLTKYWKCDFTIQTKNNKQSDTNDLRKYFIKLKGKDVAVAKYPYYTVNFLLSSMMLCGIVSFILLLFYNFRITPKDKCKAYARLALLYDSLCIVSTASIYIIFGVYVDLPY